MAEAKRNRYLTQEGFTLIEITLAIFLLAVSLVTLLGLQASVIQRSLNDRNRLDAMLIARRVLSSIESGETPATVQDNLLPASLFFDEEDEKTEGTNEFSHLKVQLKIEEWPIDAYPEAKIRRLLVRVMWGDEPDAGVSVYYFLPEDEEFEQIAEDTDME